MIDNDWDADSLEYYITKNNCYVSPSEHLQSLHPSVFWIWRINQMQQISRSVESIVIQGGVGRNEKSFTLSNLPFLISIQLNNKAFEYCHSIVFESMNDWMSDEWDLTRLQSITLGDWALNGYYKTSESNELIMKSMTEYDTYWPDLPSLKLFKGIYINLCDIGKVILDSEYWWLTLN